MWVHSDDANALKNSPAEFEHMQEEFENRKVLNIQFR